jgi:hypothetical protein
MRLVVVAVAALLLCSVAVRSDESDADEFVEQTDVDVDAEGGMPPPQQQQQKPVGHFYFGSVSVCVIDGVAHRVSAAGAVLCDCYANSALAW